MIALAIAGGMLGLLTGSSTCVRSDEAALRRARPRRTRTRRPALDRRAQLARIGRRWSCTGSKRASYPDKLDALVATVARGDDLSYPWQARYHYRREATARAAFVLLPPLALGWRGGLAFDAPRARGGRVPGAAR